MHRLSYVALNWYFVEVTLLATQSCKDRTWLPPEAAIGVNARTRTEISRGHGPGLYQLSYVHRCLVWAAGFEPAASRFQGEDSDQAELHPDGSADRTLTDTFLIDSQAL